MENKRVHLLSSLCESVWELTHVIQVSQWNRVNREVSIALQPNSKLPCTMCFLKLVRSITDRLISRRRGTATEMVAGTKSVSLAATLDQNYETEGQIHVIYEKMPKTFTEPFQHHIIHKQNVSKIHRSTSRRSWDKAQVGEEQLPPSHPEASCEDNRCWWWGSSIFSALQVAPHYRWSADKFSLRMAGGGEISSPQNNPPL